MSHDLLVQMAYKGSTPWKTLMTWREKSETPNPPKIPEFYTLTKIHKPTKTVRPIIFGWDGPIERG